MNHSSARLTQTFFALVVVGGLGFGATGCTEATTTTRTLGLPTTTTRSAASAPATSSPEPAAPEPAAPEALDAPRSDSARQAAAVPKTVTSSTVVTGQTQTGVSARREIPGRCAAEEKWGTRPVFGSLMMNESPLYLTRVGRHDCFDRVVFDINGPRAVGFVARYVPLVLADASGKPVPVAGRAALEVIVRAPIYGTDNLGHQSWRTAPTVGESLITPAAISGWPSLRAVRFAGSFEGQSTIAVGVRERLPFRAFVTRDGSYQHVVLDISH